MPLLIDDPVSPISGPATITSRDRHCEGPRTDGDAVPVTTATEADVTPATTLETVVDGANATADSPIATFTGAAVAVRAHHGLSVGLMGVVALLATL